MKRLTPLSIAAALVVTALVAALVVAGTGGAKAAGNTKPGSTFRQALAAKLGEQLHKPTADVLAALKTAHHARARRISHRRLARANPARVERKREAWAAALATPLDVSPADVTAALRALVAERLETLVSTGWITTDRRNAELACFDDAATCRHMRPPGLALLRAGA